MAEGKKSFTAYCDWQETFKSLPDDKAGQLIKHLMSYVNDENPQTDDILIKAVFAQMRATLKRDLKKWESKREQNKENALKRWNKNNANACERIKTDANHAVSVSDSVSEIIDKSITTNLEVVEKYILMLKDEHTYLEGIYRINKLQKGSVSKLAIMFKEHLKIYPNNHKNLSSFKKHFSSWISQQIQKGKFTEYLTVRKGML